MIFIRVKQIENEILYFQGMNRELCNWRCTWYLIQWGVGTCSAGGNSLGLGTVQRRMDLENPLWPQRVRVSRPSIIYFSLNEFSIIYNGVGINLKQRYTPCKLRNKIQRILFVDVMKSTRNSLALCRERLIESMKGGRRLKNAMFMERRNPLFVMHWKYCKFQHYKIMVMRGVSRGDETITTTPNVRRHWFEIVISRFSWKIL